MIGLFWILKVLIIGPNARTPFLSHFLHSLLRRHVCCFNIYGKTARPTLVLIKCFHICQDRHSYAIIVSLRCKWKCEHGGICLYFALSKNSHRHLYTFGFLVWSPLFSTILKIHCQMAITNASPVISSIFAFFWPINRSLKQGSDHKLFKSNQRNATKTNNQACSHKKQCYSKSFFQG